MVLAARTAALLAIVLSVHAQPPLREIVIRTHPYTPPSAILRVETTLVETELTVRDSNGMAVPGLEASDFDVFDNGASREISAFSELRSDGTRLASPAPGAALPPADAPAPQPKFVTFFIDDLHVPSASMLFIKQAARSFIAHGLKPSDRLSIVTSSGEGGIDFTGNAQAFAEALERLASHERPAVTAACAPSCVRR